MKDDQDEKSPGILAVIGSVLAAMIGIQSEENRERDFTKGDITNYIMVGIVVVAIFVFILIKFVNSLIPDA
ncbi:MAG: DUF2970 domain-containing protein [Kangiellaceae bacterium]|nr:DUF2970 domain-containing protein [Kangiellaceae bacterium]